MDQGLGGGPAGSGGEGLCSPEFLAGPRVSREERVGSEPASPKGRGEGSGECRTPLAALAGQRRRSKLKAKPRTKGEKERREERSVAVTRAEGRRHRRSLYSSPSQGLGACLHPGPQPWGETVEGIASLGHSGEGFQTQGFSGEFQNSSCQLGTLSAWTEGGGLWQPPRQLGGYWASPAAPWGLATLN